MLLIECISRVLGLGRKLVSIASQVSCFNSRSRDLPVTRGRWLAESLWLSSVVSARIKFSMIVSKWPFASNQRVSKARTGITMRFTKTYWAIFPERVARHVSWHGILVVARRIPPIPLLRRACTSVIFALIDPIPS